MKNITLAQFVCANNLKACDAFELVDSSSPILKHYAVLLRLGNNQLAFIANMQNGVELIKGNRLKELIGRYKVTNVERFSGNEIERYNRISQALRRLGEKTYHLIFHNCEHFKNWVLYGTPTSKQVAAVGAGIIGAGTGLIIGGMISKNNKLVKAGVIVVAVLAVLVITSAYYLNYVANKQVEKESIS